MTTNNTKHNASVKGSIVQKLINIKPNTDKYLLKCLKIGIFARILRLPSNLEVLRILHPLDACLIGKAYAQFINTNKEPELTQEYLRHKSPKPEKVLANYKLWYRDRQGNICFFNQSTGEAFLMDPVKITQTEKFIYNFDAADAFYIGLYAELKVKQKTVKTTK